ncbi:sensor histidine kinase [Fluviicola chungangensis]|uniref:histidine kinase n=1 Tax=Fluviicola chungangensis TaxID=2597671 RepID=A0A556MZU0_9FLAO|nr:sensor histidine kinase [Fluviicola chungangensis]TSJ45440.1 sensor histidine kinase [Fluviicola chungangensis]
MNPNEAKYIQERTNAILDVIMAYARLDFTQKTEITDQEDVFDAIASGVNMLGEELENSVITLQEREALLQEVHHRVKNNLQIISSLMNLQASYTKDEKFLALIRECRNRIISMSMIHEMLYRTKDLSRIQVADYIKTLTLSINSSFSGSRSDVVFDYDIDAQIYLEAERMIPIGLIINEAVSNSFKYAFPDRKGMIRISFIESGEHFCLKISDNGIGLPETIQTEEFESLGIQLINTLSDQLDAELKIVRDNGLGYELLFRIDN